jgi:hypothetical protein
VPGQTIHSRSKGRTSIQNKQQYKKWTADNHYGGYKTKKRSYWTRTQVKKRRRYTSRLELKYQQNQSREDERKEDNEEVYQDQIRLNRIIS